MFARKLFDLPGLGWRSPFSEMERMSRQMQALSNFVLRGSPLGWQGHAGVFPLVNLTQDAKSFYLRAELPGFKAEDLDIQVLGKQITLSGERKIASEGENVRYHRREREGGRFTRVIELPGEIDANGVQAKMINGMLTVLLPKSQAAQPKQITIK
jgi:HSP20 family protein